MYFPNQPTEEIMVDSPRWEATLSNGVKCYHDPSIPSSWQELKKYCEEESLKVKELKIGFRSNVIDIPSDKEGYFFRMMERHQCFGTDTMYLFVVGYVEDNVIKTRKYKVPEMTLDDIEERNIDEYKESII